MDKMYLKDVVKPGDYIEYSPTMETFEVPTGDGVRGTHVFHPAQVKNWMVLDVEQGVVEIIPAQPVGQLKLFGKTAWRNLPVILQKICENFTDGECSMYSNSLGSIVYPSVSGVTNDQVQLSAEMMKAACLNGRLHWLTDHAYATDQQHMKKKVHPHRVSYFASRLAQKTTSGFQLIARVCFGEKQGKALLAELDFSGVCRKEFEQNFEVCPVVSLFHNVGVTEGDGSKENPYKMIRLPYRI